MKNILVLADFHGEFPNKLKNLKKEKLKLLFLPGITCLLHIENLV